MSTHTARRPIAIEQCWSGSAASSHSEKPELHRPPDDAQNVLPAVDFMHEHVPLAPHGVRLLVEHHAVEAPAGHGHSQTSLMHSWPDGQHRSPQACSRVQHNSVLGSTQTGARSPQQVVPQNFSSGQHGPSSAVIPSSARVPGGQHRTKPVVVNDWRLLGQQTRSPPSSPTGLPQRLGLAQQVPVPAPGLQHWSPSAQQAPRLGSQQNARFGQQRLPHLRSRGHRRAA